MTKTPETVLRAIELARQAYSEGLLKPTKYCLLTPSGYGCMMGAALLKSGLLGENDEKVSSSENYEKAASLIANEEVLRKAMACFDYGYDEYPEVTAFRKEIFGA